MDANLKSVIETLKCPIHHKHPKMEMEKDKPIIHCCCAEFKVQCYYIYVKLLDGQSFETAVDTWQKYDFSGWSK